MKKISNRMKDIIFFLFWIFVIFIGIFAFGFAVGKCYACDKKVLDEYFSRPVIIRAYTEVDEENSAILEMFKDDGYEVGY